MLSFLFLCGVISVFRIGNRFYTNFPVCGVFILLVFYRRERCIEGPFRFRSGCDSFLFAALGKDSALFVIEVHHIIEFVRQIGSLYVDGCGTTGSCHFRTAAGYLRNGNFRFLTARALKGQLYRFAGVRFSVYRCDIWEAVAFGSLFNTHDARLAYNRVLAVRRRLDYILSIASVKNHIRIILYVKIGNFSVRIGGIEIVGYSVLLENQLHIYQRSTVLIHGQYI